jgi:hypothetical protein
VPPARSCGGLPLAQGAQPFDHHVAVGGVGGLALREPLLQRGDRRGAHGGDRGQAEPGEEAVGVARRGGDVDHQMAGLLLVGPGGGHRQQRAADTPPAMVAVHEQVTDAHGGLLVDRRQRRPDEVGHTHHLLVEDPEHQALLRVERQMPDGAHRRLDTGRGHPCAGLDVVLPHGDQRLGVLG